MDPWVILISVVVILVIIKALLPETNKKDIPTKISPIYKYSRKKEFISAPEKEFYAMLYKVAGDRYYIFPQVHLSALFKNETVGRYHKLAFQIINRRSVDYVLCDKTTLEPVYAVELDDPTHDKPDRIKRDNDVNKLFAQHHLPLIRFRNHRNLSLDDIAQRFFEAHSQ